MTADPIGGVWTYALELAGALAPRGVAVTLAVLGAPARPDQRAEAARVPGLELVEAPEPWKLEWMDEPWADVGRSGAWLLGLEAGVRPDLVHLNGYAHAALPWRAPALAVGHSCVASWWEAVRGAPAPGSWDRYRREVARGLRAAGLVLAPTRAMLAALRRHHGPLPRAGVVPNGRAPLGPAVPPGAKEPLILGVGRLWDEAKGLASLDRLAPRLPWPVGLAGDAAPPPGAGGAPGPPGGARRLGRLPAAELAGWYARAAIYALPARYEPFGLSALEAAQAGCALVLGDVPSLREVWGAAAAFVPPGDDEALAAALRALIADPARRAALAAAASARARRHTPARMAAGYLGHYRRLLAQPVVSDEL